ncbi:MAG: HD-GYP domain-containing protein [Dehalococcoidia bacterium]|nr:HD-GYP domain-containing protein [Dehalococcoidia bacterium]
MVERATPSWRGLAIGALAAPIAVFVLLNLVPALDAEIIAPTFHFYAVSFTALAAALACALVIASARTLHETRLLFLGLAFFAIAGIFAVHGLATPGFIAGQFYKSVSVSAWFSAAAGSAFVALSVVALPPRIDRVLERNGRAMFAVAACAIFGYVALSLTVETWLEWVPIDERRIQWLIGLGSMAFTGFAAWRYYQAYQFARLPSQLAMIAALVFLVEVQAIILWGEVWYLSWWIYHGLYGVAFVVLFAGWAMEVRRGGTLRAIADALSMRDALAQLNRGLETPILELVDAVELKDVETFGHVRRVSGYALAVGKRLGLPPAELRALVLAAEMHDVGKISIPTSILAKPGPLTDEEFAVVKTHTERGHAIAERVQALRSLAPVIRAHHERLDGSGYPDGLAGDEIPLLARIVAVADTYDAITSRRPYREAKGHVEAMAELFREKGVRLDPRCVDAFTAAVAESGTRLAEEPAAA